MGDGLAHVAEGAIMHDRLNRVGLETLAQLIFIRQISQHKMPPFGKLPVAAAEVIINNSFEASLIEDFIGVGTDVTGTTCDEDHWEVLGLHCFSWLHSQPIEAGAAPLD